MAIPARVRTKFYVWSALAMSLVVLGGTMLTLRSNGFWIQLLALLALFVSLLIFGLSNLLAWHAMDHCQKPLRPRDSRQM